MTNNNKIVDAGTGTVRRGNKLGTDSLFGTFTATNAATTVISNNNACSATHIRIWPTNAAAATLLASVGFYQSTYSEGTSVTLATGDASSAAGTETFGYEMIQ